MSLLLAGDEDQVHASESLGIQAQGYSVLKDKNLTEKAYESEGNLQVFLLPGKHSNYFRHNMTIIFD